MSVARVGKHLVALSLTTISATTLAAQTTVRGVVSDSLTRTPFAGASVQLVLQNAPWSAGRTTRADSTGAFRFDSVTPGIYTFGFTHPRLDSLGLDAVTRTLTIADGSTIVDASIALPGANTLATGFCGARTDTTGAMIGRVVVRCCPDHQAAPPKSATPTSSAFVVLSEISRIRHSAGCLNDSPRATCPSGGLASIF